MAAHAKRIEIAVDDRPVLQRWANARAAERRLVDRARIVLLAGEGRPASQIAERVGCSLPT
ncbi:MAG: IS630 family transposase, partial [Actinomycetota bacterium]|nr:IS630 family transposase [Actinomycetota bacterium]